MAESAAWYERLLGACRRHWTYRLVPLGGPPEAPFVSVHVPARGLKLASICLAAGLHGDEGAGVEALLRLLETQPFPRGLELDVFPCMNPAGFRAGSHETPGGVDLAREFGRRAPAWPVDHFMAAIAHRRYDLFLDLHEALGASGFWARELLGPGVRVAPAIVQAVAAAGYPLEPAARLAGGAGERTGGCLLVNLEEAPELASEQAGYMRERQAAHAVSLFAPGAEAFERRVGMHLAAMSDLCERLRRRGLHVLHPDPTYFASAWEGEPRRDSRRGRR